jgi:8-oxo-dGTP pyrophosphatase MutT (NUDIX family)
MKPGKIRPLAICVFRHRDRIFAAEGYDSLKGETFYRPLGGRIEFGEYGHQTVARELREEMGAEVVNLRYLGALENIFTYNGQPGHEIVLVYDGEFVNRAMYERESVMGFEDDEGDIKAVWKSLAFFEHGEAPLYPHGLLELLMKVGDKSS